MTLSDNVDPNGAPVLTQASLWIPKHLVLSAWTEHAPFAFWLIEALRPATVVELGTHNGLSYFAFCQAVAELGLDTRCFAVDTWEGDEHAGFYSDEVYQFVARVNTERYAAFSRLVRSTFDAAVDHFEDGSVDLLHIDGRHFYEDVAHDFETWLPKLSTRAVVLFHDTNVRERDFGVHRLWSEVRDNYHGSVEFLHGHGLGVLQVGSDIGPTLAAWFALHRDPSALVTLRSSYERLGRGVLDRFSAIENAGRLGELESALLEAKREINARDEEARRLKDSRDSVRAELDKVASTVEQMRAAIARRDESLKRLEASRDSVRAELGEAVSEVDRLHALLDQRDDAFRRLKASHDQALSSLERAQANASVLRKRLQRLRSRRAVRLALAASSPFRPLFRGVRRLKRHLAASRVEPSAASTDSGLDGRPSESDRPTPSDDGERIDSLAPMAVDISRDGAGLLAGLQRNQRLTILVPIFNAPRELLRCLESIERNTTIDALLLLINDASTDPAVQDVLEPWRGRSGVQVIDHESNRGFTATVNHGWGLADGDIIVLNSDTEVPPLWIQNLRRAAYSDATIGTVTPVSDNSGAFSVPDVGIRNPIPVHLGTDGLARLVSRCSLHKLPETPTGNGFCWYIKRPVIDSIGQLDEEAFPRGYGEENDFCMRASLAGWRHVVDDATFVAHEREASFGSEKLALVAAGRRVLNERYPEYTGLVRSFVHGPDMELVRDQVRSLLTPSPDQPRPRVLYVLQMGQGGTPQTSRDLANFMSGWEVLIFESDGRDVRLLRIDGDCDEVVECFRFSRAVAFADRQHAEYDAALSGVIRRYGIELVHIRHLIKQPLSAPRIAATLGVPVVVSFHDYYFSCPTVHLLDDSGRFCGGVCTPGMGSCRVPSPWIGDSVPELKHAWVNTWRAFVREAFAEVDAFVTTNEAARQVMVTSLPELAQRRFEVIEHGREIRQASFAEDRPSSGPVRVLVPGNLDLHKGEGLLRSIRALDVDGRFEFHFVGRISEEAKALGVDHGPYDRDALSEIVRGIRPSFAAILSPWGETYSHTLTEAWSLGLPVVACDEGALGERVRQHGGGLLIDPCDPKEAYRAMCRLVDQPDLYAGLAREAEAYAPRSAMAMARDYDELYLDVVQKRRTFAADALRPRVGLLVPGRSSVERWTGSTYVRFGRRFNHPNVRAAARVEYLDSTQDLGMVPIDVVMVLRNGALLDELNVLLSLIAEKDIKLVLDLDDALTEKDMFPVGSPWRESADDIARLAARADVVTVSTESLRELVSSQYNKNVVVVPNLLDERLWFSPLAAKSEEQERPARILYFGTTTHADDLELLRDVVSTVEERVGREVRLEVVGVVDEPDGDGWYDRLVIPDQCKPYPEFVRWLRQQRNRWDVGVAPLKEGDFNEFKSDLKYLELAALGLPVVASNVNAYRSTIDDRVTGLLVDSQVSSWADALVVLLDDAMLAADLAGNAKSYVAAERTLISQGSRHIRAALSAAGAAQILQN